MQMIPIRVLNLQNRLNREGCRCYTVNEIMVIQSKLAALAIGFPRTPLIHGFIKRKTAKDNCASSPRDRKASPYIGDACFSFCVSLTMLGKDKTMVFTLIGGTEMKA